MTASHARAGILDRAHEDVLVEEEVAVAVAVAVRKWTLAEVHRLPDDGNKYELVRGELFVTPPPTYEHETILAKLTRILCPYVKEQGLGHVYHPRSVMRFEGSEVEPDLMVRKPHPDRRGNDRDWNRAPVPDLVVEVLSPYTQRRDFQEKRDLYLDAGVPEYWIVDPESRSITVISRKGAACVADHLTWTPGGSAAPLTFDVVEVF
jgi:Uma2 family endonuclease